MNDMDKFEQKELKKSQQHLQKIHGIVGRIG